MSFVTFLTLGLILEGFNELCLALLAVDSSSLLTEETFISIGNCNCLLLGRLFRNWDFYDLRIIIVFVITYLYCLGFIVS